MLLTSGCLSLSFLFLQIGSIAAVLIKSSQFTFKTECKKIFHHCDRRHALCLSCSATSWPILMEVNEDPNIAGCDRHCANCKTTATPLWRKFGPVKFLCNACGLYYKVNHNHRPYYMSKNKLNSSTKKSLLRCANCGTNKTTMWRKNGGQHVCNPCGLYIRLNGHNRPVTMRKDIIRTRRRRDTAQFEMLDPIESCDNAVNVPVLTSIKKEELSNYEKHPYKMVLNMSRDHSFVLANGSETHETSHYGQHVCPETYHLHSHHHANHNHNESNSFPSSQHINNGQVDPNNGYYCSFF